MRKFKKEFKPIESTFTYKSEKKKKLFLIMQNYEQNFTLLNEKIILFFDKY